MKIRRQKTFKECVLSLLTMTDTPLMVFIRDAIVNIAKNIYEALDFEEMHIRIIALFEYV